MDDVNTNIGSKDLKENNIQKLSILRSFQAYSKRCFIYHIMARKNERSKIYFAKLDYEKFKQYLAEAKQKIWSSGSLLRSYEYHLIIEAPQANL